MLKANEPTITLTRSEFVQLVEKIQDLALAGAYIYLPGMKSMQDKAPASRPDILARYQGREPIWDAPKLCQLLYQQEHSRMSIHQLADFHSCSVNRINWLLRAARENRAQKTKACA